MGMPQMDEKSPDCFEVHRAPNAKFYVRWRERAICTQTGLHYFETERDALEFMAEIGDAVLN
jgi:hypothetical protein